MVRVGIIGANGYTGLELLRLLSTHKNAEVKYLASRSYAGTRLCALYPSLLGAYGNLNFSEPDENIAAKLCDVVFTALPHGASAEWGKKLINKGLKVIDLSADFRYDDIDLYEKTYKVEHPAKELCREAVYGLTEINRAKVKQARIVGNPGCYTTTSILALLPLIKENIISKSGIIIDAKSGTSGAGRKSEPDYSYCEVDENLKAYAVTTHRHTSEIEEKLSGKNEKVQLCFTPHLLSVKRGILATIYAACDKTDAEVAAAYNKFYKNEQFVSVQSEGILPELKWACGSNMCFIGYKLDTRLKRIIIVSVTDNLIKGAAGQAIQNMNVMFGFNENEGLPLCGNYL